MTVTTSSGLFVGKLWVDIANKSFSPSVEVTNIMLLELKGIKPTHFAIRANFFECLCKHCS